MVAILKPTKVCSKCGQEKPGTDFSLGKAQCKQCVSEYTRKWYTKHVQGGAPAPCKHHRVCGDALVDKEFPGFFDPRSTKHERTPAGYELQVCTECGDAKYVKLYDLNPHEPGYGAKPPTDFRVRLPWKPREDRSRKQKVAAEPIPFTEPAVMTTTIQYVPTVTDPRVIQLEAELARVSADAGKQIADLQTRIDDAHRQNAALHESLWEQGQGYTELEKEDRALRHQVEKQRGEIREKELEISVLELRLENAELRHELCAIKERGGVITFETPVVTAEEISQRLAVQERLQRYCGVGAKP